MYDGYSYSVSGKFEHKMLSRESEKSVISCLNKSLQFLRLIILKSSFP